MRPTSRNGLSTGTFTGNSQKHLGHGVYGGLWVSEDSAIPNTRGLCNDVVAALRNLKVPCGPLAGGCFADEYHWRINSRA